FQLAQNLITDVYHLHVGFCARTPEYLNIPLVEPPVSTVLRLLVSPGASVAGELNRRLQVSPGGYVPSQTHGEVESQPNVATSLVFEGVDLIRDLLPTLRAEGGEVLDRGGLHHLEVEEVSDLVECP